MYTGGSADPHINYVLKVLPTESINNMSFRIDGQTLAYSGGIALAKPFVWPGPAHEAIAAVKLGGQDVTWSNNEGLWAAFQFFGKAERQTGNVFEWVVRIGKDPALVNGKPLAVRVEVDMGAFPPVFQKGYLSSFVCESTVAR